jgi:hypothetical protein
MDNYIDLTFGDSEPQYVTNWLSNVFSRAPDLRSLIRDDLGCELNDEMAADLCDVTEQYLAGCRSCKSKDDFQKARAEVEKIRDVLDDARLELHEHFLKIRRAAMVDFGRNDLTIVWTDLENRLNLGSSGRLGSQLTGSADGAIDQLLNDLAGMKRQLDDHLARWNERYGTKVGNPSNKVRRNFILQLADIFEKCGNQLYPEDKKVRVRFHSFVLTIFCSTPATSGLLNNSLKNSAKSGLSDDTLKKYIQITLKMRKERTISRVPTSRQQLLKIAEYRPATDVD